VPTKGIYFGVKDTSSEFLKIPRQKIALGSKIETLSKSFDLPFKINVDVVNLTISNKIASNLFEDNLK
jgi:hypothetical protein